MRRVLIAVAVACALVVTGCGASAPDAPAAAGTEVTVAHRFGATTIDGVPQRIVALSSTWLDALLEFGVDPVAYGSGGAHGDARGLYPWQQEVPEGAVDLGADPTEIDPEAIAALAPDLVLTDYLVPDQAAYERVSAIAPTVSYLGDEGADAWQETVRALGRILDRPDDAERIVAEREAEFARAVRPGLEGRTGLIAQYVFGSGHYAAVVDPGDGANRVLASWGLHVPEELAGAPGASNGRVLFGPERVDLLDADLLVIMPNGGTPDDLRALPGFTDLPAVRNGGAAIVDYATVVAFNTPSSLSVRYGLDAIGAQLDAVAAA